MSAEDGVLPCRRGCLQSKAVRVPAILQNPRGQLATLRQLLDVYVQRINLPFGSRNPKSGVSKFYRH